jgi:hypothetical protein
MKKLNLTGQRFGMLFVVQEAAPSHWLCVCDCGTLVKVNRNNLRSGNSWATRSEQNRNRRPRKKPCGSIQVPETRLPTQREA